MNRTLALFGLTLALACGDFDQDEPAEFGQVEQALVRLPDGYGHIPNSDSIRCFNDGGRLDWPNDCYAPARKTVTIFKLVGSCTGTHAAVLTSALNSAVNSWSSVATQAGWSVQIKDAASELLVNRGSRAAFIVGCGAKFPGAGSGALGGTKMDPDLNCDETSAGDFCKYEVSKSRLYTSVLNADSNFVNAPTNKKEVFARTIFQHELGHAFGLGHDTCGNAPLTRMMAGLGCGWTLSNPSTWSVPSINSVEIGWLRDFSR